MCANEFYVNQGSAVILFYFPQNPWSFSSPVVIAASVEAIWTPPSSLSTPTSAHDHLMESLWLACGHQGMKVSVGSYSHVTSYSNHLLVT